MWPPRIEVALDCLSFYFDEAVEIVRRDIDKTLISRLPVNLGDFKCLEIIEYVLEDVHDCCFVKLP